MRIAMIGTRGVPARYGGFETCVEEVGRRLAASGHDVTVYCRTAEGEERLPAYLGMRLRHLPAMQTRSLETLSHTALTVGRVVAADGADAALVFNAANAVFLPALRARGIPVATHVDGLEWRRGKWGRPGRTYYRLAESLAVRWSDALIADAVGIADYYRDEFGASSDLIAYGAPRVERLPGDPVGSLGLTTHGYHLLVARFEPENHVDVVVRGYVASAARLPLVVVGTAPYADEYIHRVRALADPRVTFLGAVWDQPLLDQLYANALVYWHGHSVGGTNPSLLRAIGASAATNAFDVTFNREVLEDTGRYFRTHQDVARLAAEAEADPTGTVARGVNGGARASLYDWGDVARRYEALCVRLARRDVPRSRPSGRRQTPADGRLRAEAAALGGGVSGTPLGAGR